MPSQGTQIDGVVRPTSITLLQFDIFPNGIIANNPVERIKQRQLAVSLIASPKKLAGKFRPDVATSQSQRYTTIFTQHPVVRGAPIFDHSFVRPTIVTFSGVVTETPFQGIRDLALPGLGPGLPVRARERRESNVHEQLRWLQHLFEQRSVLFLYSSIISMDNIVITQFELSKNQDTGDAVQVNMALQQILRVNEQREKPIAALEAQRLGTEDAKSSTQTTFQGSNLSQPPR